MSKLVLIVAALFCLATMAAAQTTQITMSAFYGTDGAEKCMGTNATTTYNAGACSGTAGFYTAYYCSTAGDFVYAFQYSDSSCNSTYATSVSQFPTTCAFLAAKVQYSCINPTAGPAAPFSFPPAGWAQSTSCKNSTNSYKAATVCSAGSDATIKCTQSASIVTGCKKSGIVATPSMSTGCTADGANSAAVYYSDDKCTTVASATLAPVGCYNGVQSTCASGNTVPALPTKGFTTYDNDACAKSTSSPAITMLFADGCVNSASFACATNSTTGLTTGTYTTFYDATFKGLCPANQATVVSQTAGVCMKGKVFTCAFAPAPQPGAAPSTGVSMVAMIVAAIVALVASLL